MTNVSSLLVRSNCFSLLQYRNRRCRPPGEGIFFWVENKLPGGVDQKGGGDLFFFSTVPRGDIYPGGKHKKTHAPAPCRHSQLL